MLQHSRRRPQHSRERVHDRRNLDVEPDDYDRRILNVERDDYDRRILDIDKRRAVTDGVGLDVLRLRDGERVASGRPRSQGAR